MGTREPDQEKWENAIPVILIDSIPGQRISIDAEGPVDEIDVLESK